MDQEQFTVNLNCLMLSQTVPNERTDVSNWEALGKFRNFKKMGLRWL